MKNMDFPEYSDVVCQIQEIGFTKSEFQIEIRQKCPKLLIQQTPKQITSKLSIETACTNTTFSERQIDPNITDDSSDNKTFYFSQSTSEKVDQPSSEITNSSIVQSLKKRWQFFEQKLLKHFSLSMKIDKYLRLVCSMIKTWRAYQPKTKLNNVYKELILARRVIRWQSKYETIIDLAKQQNSRGMIMFKIMQLMGDAVDLIAYWFKIIHKGTDKRQRLIGQLEQLQSNFYFAQCSIWFAIYLYRYLQLRAKIPKDTKDAQERTIKMNEYCLKAIKYFMDIITSYNNSSLKKIIGQVNQKLSGYLTLFSSLIGIFLLWK